MEPIQRNISISKTARYFMLGNDKHPVAEILFVLHGYGMQAKDFVKQFSSLLQPGTLLVAPEGLSRFYKKGFIGEVVATWMTREDRQHEISDYIGYLDRLYDELVTDRSIKVVVLGFSQGATTASRWVMAGNRKFDGLVMWAGEFAPDIVDFNNNIKTIWQVIGSDDEFIPLEKFQKQSQLIENKGFEVVDVVFRGTHVIEEATLVKVWDDVRNHL